MMMNRFFAYVVVMLLTMTMASPVSAMTNDDDYEAQTVATSWYADRCQSILTPCVNGGITAGNWMMAQRREPLHHKS